MATHPTADVAESSAVNRSTKREDLLGGQLHLSGI
jgi:hypothetical protein